MSPTPHATDRRRRPCGGAALALALLGSGCSSPTEVADVVYDARFGAETTLDVYLPAGGGARRPAVMFFHGGLWDQGSKSDDVLAVQRLAGSGYVTASVNYRLAPGTRFPAAVQDARCALAYLRAHADTYGIDPDRIAVFGFASGGHLASMLGVAHDTPSLEPDCSVGTTGPPRAVIAHSGIHDLRLKGGPQVEAFLGGPLDQIPDRYALASPVTHVAPGPPPYLLIHGGFDFVVAEEQSKRMRAALLAVGGTVRSLELFDAGHAATAGADVGGLYYGTAPYRPETWIAISDFLDETLGAP